MPAETNPRSSAADGPGRFKRALFWLAGSAMLGSVAVALWNRRTLNNMQEAAKDAPPLPRTRDDDGIY